MSRAPSLVALVLMILLVAATANAALTTSKCLVLKRQAWGNLRKCEATEQVKHLKGKPADLAKCQAKFLEKRATIDTKAVKAAVACRYGANNSEGTVTDYDTGLQWEQKEGTVGGNCPLVVGRVLHCVNATYTWDEAQRFVSPGSTDGTTVPSFLAGSADWRLPTIVELRTLLDPSAPGCLSGSLCIDPVFGPTAAGAHWSATTSAQDPSFAWLLFFDDGGVFVGSTNSKVHVRAVRAGL